MEIDAASKLIGNFGFPIALILILLCISWRLLVWLGPRVDKIVDAHVAFLASMQAHMKCEEAATARLESSFERVATGFEQMADSWQKLKERVVVKA